jgi:hypothetical protein
MIDESQAKCRFCSVPVDPGIADLVAGGQEKTNQACSDASYLRNTAAAIT